MINLPQQDQPKQGLPPCSLSWHCTLLLRHVREGKVIWRLEDHNLLMKGGGRAIVDTIVRDNGTSYFIETDWFVGLYRGTVSRSTVLATIPGEPSGNGYSRSQCERSSVGFPTLEVDSEDYWRVVSKELTITASGGSIGPVDGAFLCTSSSSSGTLIGTIATGVQRTILAGDSMIAQLMIRFK